MQEQTIATQDELSQAIGTGETGGTGDSLVIAPPSDGLPAYGDSSSEFLPLGDEHGLLIVVSQDRPWFPERRSPARRQMLRVEAEHAGREMTFVDDGHGFELRF